MGLSFFILEMMPNRSNSNQASLLLRYLGVPFIIGRTFPLHGVLVLVSMSCTMLWVGIFVKSTFMMPGYFSSNFWYAVGTGGASSFSA